MLMEPIVVDETNLPCDEKRCDYAELMCGEGSWKAKTKWKSAVYPPPPLVYYPIESCCIGQVPKDNGVYFILNSAGCLKYVGYSQNLQRRVNSYRAHPHLEKGDYLSWLIFDGKDAIFAEAYYIGILRPYANGGDRGKESS